MKKLLSLYVMRWLRFWARLQLRKVSPDIVGITGSVGKTSTMQAVYAVLKDKYVTRMSTGANSASGIPLNILGLKLADYSSISWLRACILAPWRVLVDWTSYEKYIVEMGIDGPDAPNNMEYLLSILQPRTGIFMNVGPVHSEPFDHLVSEKDVDKRRQAVVSLIAQEKGKMIAGLPEPGLAILNDDDENVRTLKADLRAQTMTFGTKRHADIQLVSITRSMKGTTFTYRYQDVIQDLHFGQLLLPDQFGLTFAAALCIAIDEDFSLQEGVMLLAQNFAIPPGRSSLIPGKKGSLILDSSYNSSTQPLLDMLSMLEDLKPGRLISILGDMRELGDETEPEHKKVLSAAAKASDQLYLVGPAMRKIGRPFIKTLGNRAPEVYWFDTALEAAKNLEKKLKPADVVLIKGSQNELLLEIAVEQLMRRPDTADSLLCRRGAYWDRRRAKLVKTS